MKRDFVGLTFEGLREEAARGREGPREPPLEERGGFHLRREALDFRKCVERETLDDDAPDQVICANQLYNFRRERARFGFHAFQLDVGNAARRRIVQRPVESGMRAPANQGARRGFF